MQYKSIKFVPKINPDSLEVLSLIYTPGVGEACMKIKENDGLSYIYTNRENSIAVLSFEYEKSLKRAIFLKNTLNIDAFPFEISPSSVLRAPSPLNGERIQNPSPLGGEGNFSTRDTSVRKMGEGATHELLKLVVENIEPNFCGIDLTLISDGAEGIDFATEIPIMKKNGADIMDFFKPFSKNIFKFDINQLEGDFKQQALSLREKAGGVIECELADEQHQKPVAIISDGTAVLGFGNIGAEAGIPVMEGKAVIFEALGSVSAMPLCLRSQNPDEIVKIVAALKNSFSGINLEDISAPRCFEIEKKLIETLDIPVFHDDQHGTAIVVLAALLNALNVAGKKIEKVKIVISGAGAAAQAVSKLLLKAGAQNITHVDRKGTVYLGREGNDLYLQELARVTNKSGLKGTLEQAVIDADVFIGLSAAGILKPEAVKSMAENSIVFALANPVPEIMPQDAKNAGAYIVATGRSDFDNQINNSLAFPGLFRGILDNKIQKITDEIKLECAIAIASMIRDVDLSVTNIIPKALDARVVAVIANYLKKFA